MDRWLSIDRLVSVGLAVLGGLAARGAAQNPLDLEQVAGGQIGAPVVFLVGNQAGDLALPKLLVFDASSLSTGLPVPPYGQLFLPLSPLALYLAGGPGNGYSLLVPNSPGLVGVPLFAQAIGPVAGQPPGTLGFSDLETLTLLGTQPFARFLFAGSALDPGLSSFAYDSASGRLAPCGYTFLGETPSAIATSADNRFAFAALASAAQLVGVKTSTLCGDLELTGASVCDSGTSAIAIDPLGRFLFSASPVTDRILTFRIDLESGAPSPSGNPIAPNLADLTGLVVSSDGKQLYALSGSSAQLVRYTISPSDGSLGLAQSLSTPSAPASLSFSPSGSLLVVPSPSTQSLAVFQVNPSTGALSPLGPSFQALGFPPAAAAISEVAGQPRVHLADPLTASLSSFLIDSQSGALSPTSPASLAMPSPIGALRFDAGARALFASVPGASELEVLPLDSNGLPAIGSSIRTRGAPTSLALSKGVLPLVSRTRSAVVASEANGQLLAFLFSPSDGKLLATGGGLNLTGAGPVDVALAPQQDLALSADFSGGTATLFGFDNNNGQLGAGQAYPAQSPFDVAFESTGRFAYVSNSGNATISIFTRQGAQLTVSGSVSLVPNSVPRGIAIDPTGRFLYVALSLSNQISAFRINSQNGQLSPIATMAQVGGPFDVWVHPSGRFLVVSLSTQNRVKVFKIDPFSGNLAQISTTGTSVGNLPTVLTGDPQGRFLFCANSNSDTLSVFTVNPTSGNLVAVPGSPVTVLDDPRGLAVDASGTRLLVANRGLDLVQSFQIAANGALSGLSLSAGVGDAPRGLVLDLVWE